MQVFNIRIKGSNKFMPIMANTRTEAIRKFIQLINSRKMFTIPKPKLMPGSVDNSNKILRGAR